MLLLLQQCTAMRESRQNSSNFASIASAVTFPTGSITIIKGTKLRRLCNTGFSIGASQSSGFLSAIWDTLTVQGGVQFQYRIPHPRSTSH